MPAATDAVWIDVLPSMRRFGPEMQKGATKVSAQAGEQSSKRFSSAFKNKLKIAGAVAGAFAAVKVKDFLGDSISAASDLGESLNAIQVTYGDAAGAVQKLGEQAANSLGLSNVEFNNLAVQFSGFANDIAGQGGDVAGTLEQLTGRASDFASVMNLDVAEAAQLFQSGLAGETEPLRKFGIDLSAAAVQAHAVEEGISAAGGEMTEQEKVQARYSLLMQETAQTQGDFANTSDSLANSQRILGANWDDIQAQVGAKLIPALESLSGWLINTGLPALQAFGGWVGDHVLPVLSTLGSFVMEVVVPALKNFGSWISRNVDWLLPLAATVATLVASFKIYAGIQKTVTAVTAAWNAVLAMNPIGLVVIAIAGLVAALVVAYQRSETFRNIVQAAWEGVKTAILAVVSWFTDTAWPTLKAAWKQVSDAAMSLWHDVLKPVWDGIRLAVAVAIEAIKLYWEKILKPTWQAAADFARWLWNDVLKPVFGYIRAGWELLIDGVKAYWNNVLKPIWEAVASTARWLWQEVLSPVFGFIQDRWNDMLRGIQWAWRNILKPAWEAVAAAAKWLWNKVLKPVFGWIGDRWDDILRGMDVVYRNVLKPMFDAFSSAVDTVSDGVGDAVGAIGRAWNGLKRAFAAPVNWVIDNVINKFLGWVNGIAKDMGIPIDIDLIGNVSWGSSGGGPTTGGIPRNKGGIIPGGGPDRDSVMTYLTPGEFVMSRTATNRLGASNLQALNDGDVPPVGGPLSWLSSAATSALNKAREVIVDIARPGFDAAMGLMDRTVGQWGAPGQFAAGTARTLGDELLDWMAAIEKEADARVPDLGSGFQSLIDLIKSAGVSHVVSSTLRPGDKGYHGRGKAADFSIGGHGNRGYGHGGLRNIFEAFLPVQDQLAELILAGAPYNIKNGQRVGGYAWGRPGEPGNHWNHVHAAVFDEGGMLPPGVSTVANWTGQPERVLNEDQWKALSEGGRQVHYHVNAPGAYAEPITAESVTRSLRRVEALR